jgi:predicted transposase YdaD
VEGATRVLAAIRETGASVADRKTLTTIILARASANARKTLEDLMATIEWKDDFVESYVTEGLEKGLAKGLAKGRAEGAIGVKVADIVKVLSARHLQPTEAQLAQVADCADLDQLGRWFDRALTVDTADEVFKD